MYFDFFDDVSHGNHYGMLEGVSDGSAQGFVRRNEEAMMLMACMVIRNLSEV